MIINGVNNQFRESLSPHSMGLQNNMTIPSAGLDSLYAVRAGKLWSGNQVGLRGLSFDGSGFLGTGLFAGDFSTWGIGEIIFGLIGVYAIYSMVHQTKQTKYRLEGAAHRRRKSKAASYRARAKVLEEKELGGIFA